LACERHTKPVTAKRLTCYEPHTKVGSQNRDVADKASTFRFLCGLCSVPGFKPGLVTEFAEKALLDNADAFDLAFCGESFVEAFVSKLILDVRPWCEELFE
jgi:hypothetical protein